MIASGVLAAATTAAVAEPASECAALEAAFVKAPTSVPAMLELGGCNERAGKLASATHWYRRAQVAAMEQSDRETEDRAKELALTLGARVPTVTLDVTAGAAIEIDGFAVEPFQYQRYELDAGDHELVGKARGKRTVRVRLHATEGVHDRVKVAVTEDVQTIDRGHDRKRAALILGGAGTVVLGATIAYGFHERAQYNDVDTTNAERNRIVTRMRYPVTATSLLGVAAGVVMYLTGARARGHGIRADHRRRAARVRGGRPVLTGQLPVTRRSSAAINGACWGASDPTSSPSSVRGIAESCGMSTTYSSSRMVTCDVRRVTVCA